MKKIYLILAVALFVFSSCRTVEYIDRVEYKDSLVKKTHYDSIFFQIKDSIYIREHGDTIFVDRWKTVYKDHIQEKSDTIYVDVEKITEKEIRKEPSKIMRFLSICGVIFWLLLICAVIYFVRKKWG